MTKSEETVVECLMSDTFDEAGIGEVIIARQKSARAVRALIFLVDVFCTGVKHCLARNFTNEEFQSLKRRRDGMIFRSATLAEAKKFLADAVTYARGNGLSPHPDFEAFFQVFNEVDAAECTKVFSFGKDGKPLYVSGPKDSPQTIQSTLDKLHRTLGPTGFHYVIRIPERSLDWDDQSIGDDAPALEV